MCLQVCQRRKVSGERRAFKSAKHVPRLWRVSIKFGHNTDSCRPCNSSVLDWAPKVREVKPCTLKWKTYHADQVSNSECSLSWGTYDSVTFCSPIRDAPWVSCHSRQWYLAGKVLPTSGTGKELLYSPQTQQHQVSSAALPALLQWDDPKEHIGESPVNT